MVSLPSSLNLFLQTMLGIRRGSVIVLRCSFSRLPMKMNYSPCLPLFQPFYSHPVWIIFLLLLFFHALCPVCTLTDQADPSNEDSSNSSNVPVMHTIHTSHSIHIMYRYFQIYMRKHDIP